MVFVDSETQGKNQRTSSKNFRNDTSDSQNNGSVTTPTFPSRPFGSTPKFNSNNYRNSPNISKINTNASRNFNASNNKENQTNTPNCSKSNAAFQESNAKNINNASSRAYKDENQFKTLDDDHNSNYLRRPTLESNVMKPMKYVEPEIGSCQEVKSLRYVLYF